MSALRLTTRPALLLVSALVIGVSPAINAAESSGADGSDSGANVLSLHFKIEKLEARIRRMQGEIDTLKHRLAQNRELQKKNYEALSKRVSGGGDDEAGQGAEAESGMSQSAEDSAEAKASGKDDTAQKSASENSSGQEQASSSSESQHAQYMDAFNTLKDGDYSKAAAGFQQFAKKHPDTGLTDNAYYWRGEALYVQKQYAKAKKAYSKVVNNFPNSPKKPNALYKIALIQIRSGQQDNAKSTLDRVIKNYGDSRAATLADKKREELGS
ncbi:tol-pal system protein YbgF [Salinisphaera sp. USBA-960]|uniref:tol-pal system protein YbgF n=1 Tax=Salinisphaera orenii TaxID=856731 RepID=UPI000DBE2F3B|nr:tol-pal system protein YbgF [Salifodinibacter halophilus]NNC25994.1 tol-pal system protein YbgF [Salifodinibacter halophilus]